MQKQSATWRSTELAQTPYQKAQQEWDRRMGAAFVQAANWGVIAFGLAGVLLFSTAGNIYLHRRRLGFSLHIIQTINTGVTS